MRKRHGELGQVTLTTRVVRARTPVFSGPEARYDLIVTDGQVDRAEWAKVVQELLDTHTKGKKEPFARLIGVNARTVHSWLDQTMSVSEQSVRRVAAACGLSAIDLLVRVGVYARDEIPAPAIPVEDAWIVELVNGYDFSPAKKKQLTAVLLEQARREREEAKRRIEEQLTVLGGKPPADDPDTK